MREREIWVSVFLCSIKGKDSKRERNSCTVKNQSMTSIDSINELFFDTFFIYSVWMGVSQWLKQKRNYIYHNIYFWCTLTERKVIRERGTGRSLLQNNNKKSNSECSIWLKNWGKQKIKSIVTHPQSVHVITLLHQDIFLLSLIVRNTELRKSFVLRTKFLSFISFHFQFLKMFLFTFCNFSLPPFFLLFLRQNVNGEIQILVLPPLSLLSHHLEQIVFFSCVSSVNSKHWRTVGRCSMPQRRQCGRRRWGW